MFVEILFFFLIRTTPPGNLSDKATLTVDGKVCVLSIFNQHIFFTVLAVVYFTIVQL